MGYQPGNSKGNISTRQQSAVSSQLSEVRSQQTTASRQKPAVSSQQSAVSSSDEQRQQTRVLGQYSHHQNCEHHRGQRGGGAPAAAAAAGSEESAVERGADPGQGHQPQIQGGTLQVPESQQESLLLPAQVQSDLLAPPLLAPAAEGRVQGGEQQQQQQPGEQQQQHQLLARWWTWTQQRLETGQSPPVPQHPAHLGLMSRSDSMQSRVTSALSVIYLCVLKLM